MKLNELSARPGATKTKRRVGRGIGSGKGKTAGSGHNGQKSRSGVSLKGFEGGQMPLQRRIPKRGFRSMDPKGCAEVRLDTLNKLSGDIDLAALKESGLVPRQARRAKIVRSGEISNAVNLKGIAATAGAREAIEAAGGSLAE